MEFWAVLLVILVGTAVLIMLVDFGIKAAILEESNRLRLKIEEWDKEHGRGTAEANPGRTDNDSGDNTSVPIPLLVDSPAGMETADVPNGTKEAVVNPRARRRPKSSRQTDNSGIQDGNESVG